MVLPVISPVTLPAKAESARTVIIRIAVVQTAATPDSSRTSRLCGKPSHQDWCLRSMLLRLIIHRLLNRTGSIKSDLATDKLPSSSEEPKYAAAAMMNGTASFRITIAGCLSIR
ncbi:hypothetical protein D3C75_805380 [compost metagenome]